MIKMAVISDLHLGHPKHTTDIIDNLDLWLSINTSKLKDIDIFFISGDVFDRLLTSSNPDAIDSYGWLIRLVKFCSRYGIKLRILEGTPSHDWKQVKLLYNIIKEQNIDDVDFKYIEDLSIEYIKDLNINILYVPDEWRSTTEQTTNEIKDLLLKHKLDKVDIAVMHGAFNYQLPDIVDNTFDPDELMKLVKGPIIIGHIHLGSIYKNILAPGSFDRLNFADEDDEKKGYILTYDKTTGEWESEPLYNRKSIMFKSFTIEKNSDLDRIYRILDKLYKKHKKAYIRFITKDDINIKEIEDKYPNFIFNKKKQDNKIDNDATVKDLKERIMITRLDKTTIVQYLENEATNEKQLEVIRKVFES